MSWQPTVITAGGTATVVCNAGGAGVLVQNLGGTAVFIGGSAVASSGVNQGFQLPVGGVPQYFPPMASMGAADAGGVGSAMFAITAGGSAAVACLPCGH